MYPSWVPMQKLAQSVRVRNRDVMCKKEGTIHPGAYEP